MTHPETNPDLFWAIKGGGGGTWGVITSVTIKMFKPLCEKMDKCFSAWRFTWETNYEDNGPKLAENMLVRNYHLRFYFVTFTLFIEHLFF